MEIVYKVLNSLSNSKLLVPLGEGGTGWVEGVKMWWKDVGQCEGWSLGGQAVPPTLLGVILSFIKCYCLSLSLKIIPFTFSVDYLSQLEWCIWHQCSESVRVGRAGLNPSIPTQYYALFSIGGRLDFPQKHCFTWKREI